MRRRLRKSFSITGMMPPLWRSGVPRGCQVKIVSGLVLVLWLLGPAGCAVQGNRPAAVPGTTAELPAGEGWWYARFRVVTVPEQAPLWHIDTLIAGEIITPVFEHNFQDIHVWRVHRRAPDDAYGHVFSFIFYSSPQAAQRIYNEIHASPVLADLQAKGLVTDVMFDDLAVNKRPAIEDTSDRSWPPMVQKTWPAMIMGASRMWLDLVGGLAASHADEPDLVHRYELVEQDMNRLWATQGQHAFLHHLDALFAYQPLLIRY
jgi:hypothetical protein